MEDFFKVWILKKTENFQYGKMKNLSFSVETRSDKAISFEESLFIAEEQTQVEIIPNIKMGKKLIFSVSLYYLKCK